MDYVADAMGVPLIPSYIPRMCWLFGVTFYLFMSLAMLMEAGSKMTFYERVKSFIGHALFKFMYPRRVLFLYEFQFIQKFRFVPNRETQLFRKHISPDFPDLMELSKQVWFEFNIKLITETI